MKQFCLYYNTKWFLFDTTKHKYLHKRFPMKTISFALNFLLCGKIIHGLGFLYHATAQALPVESQEQETHIIMSFIHFLGETASSLVKGLCSWGWCSSIHQPEKVHIPTLQETILAFLWEHCFVITILITFVLVFLYLRRYETSHEAIVKCRVFSKYFSYILVWGGFSTANLSVAIGDSEGANLFITILSGLLLGYSIGILLYTLSLNKAGMYEFRYIFSAILETAILAYIVYNLGYISPETFTTPGILSNLKVLIHLNGLVFLPIVMLIFILTRWLVSDVITELICRYIYSPVMYYVVYGSK